MTFHVYLVLPQLRMVISSNHPAKKAASPLLPLKPVVVAVAATSLVAVVLAAAARVAAAVNQGLQKR